MPTPTPTPQTTTGVGVVKKHILTQAQYDALSAAGEIHQYEEYYITDGAPTIALEQLDNVNITNPQNGNTLIYDSLSDTWVNANGGTSSAVTATELVDTLCADSDFQTWAAAQVPRIPVVEPRGWDDDIATIITVYSKFIEDTNNVSTSWGTVISNNVDGDGELYAVSSFVARGGVNIPQQPTAPENPQGDDLWIDTSVEVPIPNTIPVPTAADAGKVLMVDENGNYVLVAINNANNMVF